MNSTEQWEEETSQHILHSKNHAYSWNGNAVSAAHVVVVCAHAKHFTGIIYWSLPPTAHDQLIFTFSLPEMTLAERMGKFVHTAHYSH
jgi:hypothetical protein